VNWQNLPARGISAGLRNAIKAPDGHVIVVGDSAGIELRVAMVLARQLDLVDKIAQGADLYCDFASKIFGRTITKADKMERLLGKIAMLSLQYGAGWVKFKEMVRLQGGGEINDSQAQHIVDLYRSVHSAVTGLWQRFDRVVLPEIASGCPNLITVDENGWLLCANEGFSLHGQPGVRYHNLKKNTEGDWVYQMGREYPKIYGGKCMENACQYLARMIVMWQTAKINSRYPVALSVHDEAVCVVPKEQELECVSWMTACLSEAPPWCRGSIPLSCEVGVGNSYGEAK
jgi:DNA polymerase bacteriophage-type